MIEQFWYPKFGPGQLWERLAEEVEKNGGKVVESISSNTSYLINNDINSVSSKNKQAKERGIPIITEEQLLEMI